MDGLSPAALGLLLGPWSWFIAAGVLMILELFVPGAFLLWLGLAAAATGVLDLAVGVPWPAIALVFAVMALLFVLAGRGATRRWSAAASGDNPFLNRRGEALVGRDFVLADAIVGGAGRVRVDDTVWRVAGPDMPAGARVKVQAIDGVTLLVVKA